MSVSLQNDFGRTHRMKRPVCGFTLLELLVAIAILAMIVLMMVGVFHQARVAWGTGLRNSRLCMSGRALANFIANELSQAVADDKLPCMINNNSPGITFYTFANANDTNRTMRMVTYSFNSGAHEVRRRVRDVAVGAGYPTTVREKESILAREVAWLRFYAQDSQNYTTNLPLWVDVDIRMGYDTKESKITAGSSGPDRKWNTPDDIWSDDR